MTHCNASLIPTEYKGQKTDKKCSCGNYVYKEIEDIDYPYVCLYCDENLYDFEVE